MIPMAGPVVSLLASNGFGSSPWGRPFENH